MSERDRWLVTITIAWFVMVWAVMHYGPLPGLGR